MFPSWWASVSITWKLVCGGSKWNTWYPNRRQTIHLPFQINLQAGEKCFALVTSFVSVWQKMTVINEQQSFLLSLIEVLQKLIKQKHSSTSKNLWPFWEIHRNCSKVFCSCFAFFLLLIISLYSEHSFFVLYSDTVFAKMFSSKTSWYKNG